MINKIYFNNYKNNFLKTLSIIDFNQLRKLFLMINSIKKNKILIFGNGAGASIASHFANDLSNVANMKVLSFDNSAHITCFANDYGFENWVIKTIEIFISKNDFVILLSASGNSQNMIKAAEYCKVKKIKFFSITGFKKKNKLNLLSKNHIWINSINYNYVEIGQLLILSSIVDHFSNKKVDHFSNKK
jgi:D-sedoheptulose 7-phosphate isomerase